MIAQKHPLPLWSWHPFETHALLRCHCRFLGRSFESEASFANLTLKMGNIPVLLRHATARLHREITGEIEEFARQVRRQVVLDTETTGLRWEDGHRVVEIGCVELIDGVRTGNTWQSYINPGMTQDPAAIGVHGLTDAFLKDKPTFAQVAPAFLAFIEGAELLIHNAPFDVGFLDAELQRLPKREYLSAYGSVVDTCALSRELLPDIRHSLNALAEHFGVTRERTFHGALLDAEILTDIYLAMVPNVPRGT